MTDRTTPTMDEVEDRLRRTFAAHAEDLVEGDGEDEPVVLGPVEAGARTVRSGDRWGRPLRAAAALVVALVAASAVGLALRDGGESADVAAGRSELRGSVAAVTAPRALVEALQNERYQAEVWLMGFEDVIRLPVADAGEARAATDAAIADLESVAGGFEGAYDAGLAALRDLGAVRDEIDADPAPRSVTNPVAQLADDRYSAVIEALLDDQMAVASAIDDPSTRVGAVAYARGLGLAELTVQLARAGLQLAVAPEGTEPVAELSRLHTLTETALDLLVTETDGSSFERAVEAAVAEFEASGLLGVTLGAIESGGPPSVSVLVAVLDTNPWPVFLDEVGQELSSEG